MNGSRAAVIKVHFISEDTPRSPKQNAWNGANVAGVYFIDVSKGMPLTASSNKGLSIQLISKRNLLFQPSSCLLWCCTLAVYWNDITATQFVPFLLSYILVMIPAVQWKRKTGTCPKYVPCSRWFQKVLEHWWNHTHGLLLGKYLVLMYFFLP